MDTYADDLSELIETLDLKALLSSASPRRRSRPLYWPPWLETRGQAALISLSAADAENGGQSDGLPMEVFDEIRLGSITTLTVLQGSRQRPVLRATGRRKVRRHDRLVLAPGHASRHKNTSTALRRFRDRFHRRPEEVRRADAGRHGDDDQVVPIGAALSAIEDHQERDPEDLRGRTHGVAYTHKDQLNADLLAFLKI